MLGLGATEIVIIAFIIFLFFGGKKLPEFIKSLGEAMKEFKKSSSGSEQEKTKKKKS